MPPIYHRPVIEPSPPTKQKMHLIYDEGITIGESKYRWRLWASHGRPYLILVSSANEDDQPCAKRCKIATAIYNETILRIAKGGSTAFIYACVTRGGPREPVVRTSVFDRVSGPDGIRFYMAKDTITNWEALEKIVGGPIDRS